MLQDNIIIMTFQSRYLVIIYIHTLRTIKFKSSETFRFFKKSQKFVLIFYENMCSLLLESQISPPLDEMQFRPNVHLLQV